MSGDVEELLARAGQPRSGPVDVEAVWARGRERRRRQQARRRAVVAVAAVVLAVPAGTGVVERLTALRAAPQVAAEPGPSGGVPAACPAPPAPGPEGPATRGDGALAVTAAIAAAGHDLPSAPPDHFLDDDGDDAELAFDQLAALGVSRGTEADGPVASPGTPLKRGQLASLLVRTHEALVGALPGERADDAPHATDLEKAIRAGLVSGVPGVAHDPFRPVSQVELERAAARLEALLAGRPLPACD